MASSLGTKLIDLRQQRQLSQTEAADSIQVSQNAYSKWEADKSKPSADNLIKLSQYYDIDIFELLSDNEKISFSNNGIEGENHTVSPINTQSSTSLTERILQGIEQSIKMQKEQLRMIKKLSKKNS